MSNNQICQNNLSITCIYILQSSSYGSIRIILNIRRHLYFQNIILIKLLLFSEIINIQRIFRLIITCDQEDKFDKKIFSLCFL